MIKLVWFMYSEINGIDSSAVKITLGTVITQLLDFVRGRVKSSFCHKQKYFTSKMLLVIKPGRLINIKVTYLKQENIELCKN